MKKTIRNLFIAVIAIFSVSVTSTNDFSARANVINPTQKDHEDSGNDFRKALGKRVYNIYHPIDQKLNGDTYHYMLTATNKIDFRYYNKYSSIRKYFGSPSSLYVNDETTTVDDINNAPWAEDSNDNLMRRKLFNGRDVYYHINATGELADLYNAAVTAWNDLGVIHFIPINSNNENVI